MFTAALVIPAGLQGISVPQSSSKVLLMHYERGVLCDTLLQGNMIRLGGLQSHLHDDVLCWLRMCSKLLPTQAWKGLLDMLIANAGFTSLHLSMRHIITMIDRLCLLVA